MNNLEEKIDECIFLLKKKPIVFNVDEVKTALRCLYFKSKDGQVLKEDLIKLGTHKEVKKEQWQSRIKAMMQKQNSTVSV